MKPELPVSMTRLSGRRGFTLAELLVVIAIIAVVIALIVPALGGSRNAARGAATSNMLKQIGNAVSVFGNENSGAMPGPFTARQMAHTDNNDRGMSMGENIMLGLMGWQTNPAAGQNVDVGPISASTIPVDPELIGVPGPEGKQYFTPDKKYYVPQLPTLGQVGQAPHTDAEGNPQLPDVVDAWGAPLLFWVQDDTYITKPSSTNNTYKFAVRDSGTGTTGAKFYWMHNKCFLEATALGKRARNQLDTNDGTLMNILANGNETRSVTGALGNPNAPWRDPQNLNAVPTVPLSGRAPFIVQSAGIDGYYLGKKDKGGKLYASGTVTYGSNFAPNITLPISATNQYLDKNGKPTNIDLLADFDDLFSYGGT